ncbi:hypothetical protein [Parablautia sp. Marseille-Q6255]|uniref:hypothetical protein n=1 Tax=Parablautia sp. Marseille-Q6255 TaxID=3039593 RepID=UPI0024BC47BF|nr:hypothetical protein [Parablautia sp. Marseille-Q6255]
MSNKLIKAKDLEAKMLRWKRIWKLCAVLLAVFLILFVFLWTRVAITSAKFEKQMEQMVLGKDYFMEDVAIRKKDTDSSPSGRYGSSTNYFFYYDTDKKMQVPEKIYGEYEVGDSIPAYTTDHVYYGYEKYGILPRNEFRDNELMKAAGAVCGIAICMLALYLFLCKPKGER